MRPILGQECIVPNYGLGRVTDLPTSSYRYIGVTPYIAGHQMHFAVENVWLVKLETTRVST